MDTKRLAIPLLEKDVWQLNVRDVVYLNGLIYTRHDEICKKNILPPHRF